MKTRLLLACLFTSTLVRAEDPPPAAPAESLSKLEGIGVERFGKRAAEVMAQYVPAVATARLSTVRVFIKGNEKQLAMATVVSASGYLISKASELEKSPDLEVLFTKSPVFPQGLRLGAKIVDTYRPFDLALLKVEATGLNPATFPDLPPPVPGTFLAAVGIEETPITTGVVSVNIRNLDDSNKGFLGVRLESTEQGLSIRQVTEKSAAADAGLKENDIVLQVNGRIVATVEEFIRTVSSFKPTERIQLHIKRAEEIKDVEAVLRRRGEFPGAVQNFEDPRSAMSGALSDHRTGFPAAMQHDLFLKPSDCGGPLTDLDGRIVGVNIAHSGRIESLAIPSSAVAMLLKSVDQGKFFHPEIDELQKAKTNLEGEVQRLDEMEARIKKQLDDISGKLQSLMGGK